MNEVMKTCFTILCSFIILYIVEMSQRIPEDYEESLVEDIEEGEIHKIRKK